MGGQACVLYGAAQFSKDIDFLVLAGEENFDGLFRALTDLQAKRIAIPPFDREALARGHAVHFRCGAAGVEGLRIDVMTRLRNLPDFDILWENRTSLSDGQGGLFEVLSIADLVAAKKTQRTKDWPMIEALVENHFFAMRGEPSSERIEFWLRESRSDERLLDLVKLYPAEAAALMPVRPLLALAATENLPMLRTALDAEMRAEQEKDRIYWEPLKRELGEFRRAECEG